MRFYLSSYKLGNEVRKLKKMLPRNRRTAFIPNAADPWAKSERTNMTNITDMAQLRAIGLKPEVFDLKQYFGKAKELEKKLDDFGVIWVRGGNTFVLRQAMRLSGFDIAFKKLMHKRDMLYGGYSAGICILAPSLHGIELMDDKTQKPYGKRSRVIYEALGVLDYYIVPHYKSDHPETKLADKAVQYFINNKMLFRTLRDGEVIVTE